MTRAGCGNAEHVIEIVCDDPSHDERVIATLGYWSTPPDVLAGFINWIEAIHPDPCQPPALQTLFGEKAAAERRAGEAVDLGGWNGTPKGMDYATRWRFECGGCCTVPVRGDRMIAILNSLHLNGVARLSLQQLTAILNM